jgi:hypothetical protein
VICEISIYLSITQFSRGPHNHARDVDVDLLHHSQDVFALLCPPTTTKTSFKVNLLEILGIEVEVDDQLFDAIGSSEVIIHNS